MKTKINVCMIALLVLFGSQAAMAQCFIGGTITASPNSDTTGPAWVYTMVVNWDTGSQYCLSHINLIMDSETGSCTCQDFIDTISWDDTVGSSDGYPDGCNVDYQACLSCSGDPSIPDVEGIILKIQPVESDCVAGQVGEGTFQFYSNLPPASINEELLSVMDKSGQEYCTGYMSGDFPAMPCGPVGVEEFNWGNLKGMFR